MDDFTKVITRAKTTSGLTAAEFDYSLAVSDTSLAGAINHISNAIYMLANPTESGSATERHDRGMAMSDQLRPQVHQLIADAKAKKYTGWSDASRGPIRYA